MNAPAHMAPSTLEDQPEGMMTRRWIENDGSEIYEGSLRDGGAFSETACSERGELSDEDDTYGLQSARKCEHVKEFRDILTQFEQREIENDAKINAYKALLRLISKSVMAAGVSNCVVLSVVVHPNESKYRRLRCDNPKLIIKVTPPRKVQHDPIVQLTGLPLGPQLLIAGGFVLEPSNNIWRYPADAHDIAHWSLKALKEHLKEREEAEFRRERDRRIQEERERDIAIPKFHKKDATRNRQVDKERARVIEMVERDKKEREAAAKFSVPPSLHRASAKTVSSRKSKEGLFDSDEEAESETRLFIQAPPVTVYDRHVKPIAIRVQVSEPTRETGIRTIQTLNSPLDFERPRSSSVNRIVSYTRSPPLPFATRTGVHRSTTQGVQHVSTRISEITPRSYTPVRQSTPLRYSVDLTARPTTKSIMPSFAVPGLLPGVSPNVVPSVLSSNSSLPRFEFSPTLNDRFHSYTNHNGTPPTTFSSNGPRSYIPTPSRNVSGPPSRPNPLAISITTTAQNAPISSVQSIPMSHVVSKTLGHSSSTLRERQSSYPQLQTIQQHQYPSTPPRTPSSMHNLATLPTTTLPSYAPTARIVSRPSVSRHSESTNNGLPLGFDPQTFTARQTPPPISSRITLSLARDASDSRLPSFSRDTPIWR